ncbi:MAG: hypothetical protein QXQ63_04365 [Candidatus Bathyarchaeia archaeon]
MDLDEVRQMLGCDADFFYSTVQVASQGSAARVFVALFMNRNHWLTLEQISAITDLSIATITCHAIPILKRLGLVEEKAESGIKKYRYRPLLGFS